MRYLLTVCLVCGVLLAPGVAMGQSVTPDPSASPSAELTESATDSANLSPSPSIGVLQEPSIFERREQEKEAATRAAELEEEIEQRAEEDLKILFQGRVIPEDHSITPFNFIPYTVQYAVRKGLPPDTIILILLLPILASIVTFFRIVIGVPSLGMLVPIALSITFLATGITIGLILLLTIILGSVVSRLLLKKVRIMQLPKVSLSMFIISIFIFIILMISASLGMFAVKQLSIFPVLLLILLSERIVNVHFERSYFETLQLTLSTFLLGIGGYYLLTAEIFRAIILVYPELILLLIPGNILLGRYFGLRLTEYYSFSPMRHASE